jgi:hypothetical protein
MGTRLFQRRKNDGDAPPDRHIFRWGSRGEVGWKRTEAAYRRVIDRRNGEVQSARFSSRADSAFEHDQEKACPGLDPGWKPVL